MPHRCWIDTAIGRLRARFVPTERVRGSAWGPVFLGMVYLSHDGVKRSVDRVSYGRYFADELEPWD